jgi:hypothetical protein
MLHVFHLDVAKVDRNVAHIVMLYTHMFQVYIPNVSAVSDVCCKCFYLYIAYIAVAIHICCKRVF